MTASALAASAVCRRPGMTSATVTCRTPRSFSHITVPGPMGPAPNTMTLSVVRAFERFTQCRATAMGSLSAAISKGRVSGKTATLVPATAFSMSRYSLRPPSGPPQPMMPDGAAVSVPQMPQARTRTSRSRGPGAVGWISATLIVPGAAVCTDFIVGMELFLSGSGSGRARQARFVRRR